MQEYIEFLKVFDNLPFNIGKTTLIDLLLGNPNPTIIKRRLDELPEYGKLYQLNKQYLYLILSELIKQGYLVEKQLLNGYKVIARTTKGEQEILLRQFKIEEKNLQLKTNLIISEVTEEDKKIFEKFNFFLEKYNLQQKKAIISTKNKILCIAGAGTGKTTVLTKRIEFLVKFRSIKEEKILAITFTRKARDELSQRLKELKIENVRIETFNSYAEKLLKKKSPKKIIDFKNKIRIIKEIINEKKIDFHQIKEYYFSKKQLIEKSNDELFLKFVSDIFSILDHYKNKEKEITKFYEHEKSIDREKAKKIYEIVIETEKKLKKNNLRDFSDQIRDALEIIEEKEFDHILIDEFQDINLPQLKLIKKLNPENLFAVGDPRQSIYGWRGSEVEYILNFQEEFKSSEVIALNKNYRSKSSIVDFFNLAISPMKLPDLKPTIKEEKSSVYLFKQESEKIEQIFITESIKNSKTTKNEIFVLARTHKILEKFAEIFSKSSIPFTIKTEDNNQELEKNKITLATVHAIKGMEAEEVYLVSANSLSFPNKVADNHIFSLVKQDDNYDKYQEELRLFYVALSRAKKKLIISYTGNPTQFITSQMLEIIENNKQKKLFQSIRAPEEIKKSTINNSFIEIRLREWRNELSKKIGLPVYMIIPNKTIEEIARIMPQSKSEMFKIKGLGPTKIAKYGNQILEIINGN